MRELTRRTFLGASATALAALGAKAAPSERLRVAVIGIRGQGGFHARLWAGMPDVEVVALCDVDERVFAGIAGQVEKKSGKKPRYEKDMRRLFEDKSIDAVSIATPNHWHILPAIWAVQAGKDVYVEKPVSHNIWEGRKLVEAARKHGRLVQHGTYPRSNAGMREAMGFLASGELGAPRLAHGKLYRPRKPIGSFTDEAVPPGVDYDLWLGPAPVRPYNKNRFHYNWHWNWDYGNGEIGNNGVYQLDGIVWGLGKSQLPKSVVSVGGRVASDDDGQTPTVQISLLDYGDVQVLHECRGIEDSSSKDFKTGVVFECEKGRLDGTTAQGKDGQDLKRFTGGGAHLEQFRNFVDAVKARKVEELNADILGGHLAAGMCHMANISLRLGEETPVDAIKDPFGASAAGNAAFAGLRDYLKAAGLDLAKTKLRVGPALSFDPEKEAFVGHDAANALVRREYRKPFVIPDAL